MDLGSALLALLIALVVKAAVMVLGARMVLRVYRAAYSRPPGRLWLLVPESNLPEFRLLWWAFVLFFVSEFTCGIEVYILFRSSVLLGAVHGVSSAAGMALFAVGMYVYLDKQCLHYGDPACLAGRLCRGCTVADDPGCKFLPVMLLLATFVVMAALGALFVPTGRLAADTRKYILPFASLNAWYDGAVVPWLTAHVANYKPSGEAYYLPSSIQVLEFRVLPLIAAALAAASIVLMRGRREALGIRLACAAFGILCYVHLGIFLSRATGDILIGSLGHELAELWFLVVTAEFLTRCFGRREG